MSLGKLSSIFAIIIIAIVYMIIFTALKIMNKDIKGSGRRRVKRNSVGLEIIKPGNSANLRKGGVIPIQKEITIGRRSGNTFVLDDPYVSSHHARIFAKNNEYILEDLESTNGTLVNEVKISGRKYLRSGDIIKIGNTVLKFIG
ncbi:FHA domain-containing protein FhaB [Clostridium liquoris]|jgi:pSer/pThr/pTyr-binding forkhead associated (FHA) protein|uniref:FHA domain-containing protein FhaB n=1 Tax=Clostridium liquoris TaxID=1289519 RepID=A0A2T0B9N1_9CLOT|nr:FHA domain-containing protein [Clostridium liquoris]PRR80598.1 FHA domain-containing protein FhaB [Clostridium liquoris]